MTILDTLDELTKERREQHVPALDDGTFGKAQKITVKPLLTRIRERTYPSGEQNGGSAGLKSTRAPIDFDALAVLSPIIATINAWCMLEEVDLVRDPAVDLRRWYFRWEAHPREDYEREFHEKHMRRWVRQIKDYLDPPVTFDADDPCPICGSTEWGDVINGGGSHPIRIQYRKIDGAMRDERALCRACQTVWDGHDAVTELGDELAEKRGMTRGTA